MTWTYENETLVEIPEGMVGFVYLITNTINGRKYVGKKNFYFSKTKMVKGKKKRFKVESDWLTYYGSNKELLQDVADFGTDCFKREILRMCKSKGEFGYFEAKYQFEWGVLESDDYYNSYIQVRVNKSHLTFLKG